MCTVYYVEYGLRGWHARKTVKNDDKSPGRRLAVHFVPTATSVTPSTDLPVLLTPSQASPGTLFDGLSGTVYCKWRPV